MDWVVAARAFRTFSESEVDAPLIIENEYGRILLELGAALLASLFG